MLSLRHSRSSVLNRRRNRMVSRKVLLHSSRAANGAAGTTANGSGAYGYLSEQDGIQGENDAHAKPSCEPR